MYLGRWRQSWPGLEDLARTNKLAARSEAGHVSWLISGRIRFPFVHATLPSVGFLSIGIPLYLRQFKFLAPGGRLQAPAPSNFFRIAAMMIPERRSISNTYSCILFLFLFFFLRGVNPFLAPNGTIESPSNWKYWKHFAKSLAKIIPARRIELERWLLWIDHIVYRFRIGIVEFELLLIPLLCRAIFLVILSV